MVKERDGLEQVAMRVVVAPAGARTGQRAAAARAAWLVDQAWRGAGTSTSSPPRAPPAPPPLPLVRPGGPLPMAPPPQQATTTVEPPHRARRPGPPAAGRAGLRLAHHPRAVDRADPRSSPRAVTGGSDRSAPVRPVRRAGPARAPRVHPAPARRPGRRLALSQALVYAAFAVAFVAIAVRFDDPSDRRARRRRPGPGRRRRGRRRPQPPLRRRARRGPGHRHGAAAHAGVDRHPDPGPRPALPGGPARGAARARGGLALGRAAPTIGGVLRPRSGPAPRGRPGRGPPRLAGVVPRRRGGAVVAAARRPPGPPRPHAAGRLHQPPGRPVRPRRPARRRRRPPRSPPW